MDTDKAASRLRRVGRLRAGSSALAVFLLILAPPAGGAEAPTDLGTLRVGKSIFWGPFHLEKPSPLVYEVKLEGRGHRLRVALDHSELSDRWRLEVSGGGRTSTARGPYSMEAFVLVPRPGIYTIRAVPVRADTSVVRLRAFLEPEPAEGNEHKKLLPNLRVVPPYELTFRGPWYLGFVGAEDRASCFPEEVVEHGATRCLRFSFGPENNGAGPLVLRLAPPHEEGGETIMYQRIYRGNGSFEEVAVGTYEYHAAHAHFHHPFLAGQQLFRVANAKKGRLEEAGEAKKTGFCTADYLMVDWRRFYHAPINSVPTSCELLSVPARNAYMGMSTGWADIYYWGLEGNFVDFSDQADGFYVLRTFAGRGGGLRESSEKDNVSYAYFKVTGDKIELLERGYGTDPWDGAKVVLEDPRNHAIP